MTAPAKFDIASVTRIGCKRDARKALRGELAYLGNGAYRMTYTSPDGAVVYKVTRLPSFDHANRLEYATVQRARQSDVGREYILPTTAWVVDGVMVLAQPRLACTAREALEGSSSVSVPADEVWLAADDIENVAGDMGIDDMHMGNWGFDHDGRAWIMDANIAWSVA